VTAVARITVLLIVSAVLVAVSLKVVGAVTWTVLLVKPATSPTPLSMLIVSGYWKPFAVPSGIDHDKVTSAPPKGTLAGLAERLVMFGVDCCRKNAFCVLFPAASDAL
jgi:ABC-type Mn2+/Zn2+ transport system permease subunit